MQRIVFNEDHEAFRKTIRDFIAKEVVPVHHEWEKQGHPPRDFYNKLGELGVLGIEAPEACADVEHPQRSVGQRVGQVGLEHG